MESKLMTINKLINQHIGQKIFINGWVKFNRDNGNLGFIELFDGTSFKKIQIVYKKDFTKNFLLVKKIRIGAAIQVFGELKINQKNSNNYEVLADEIILLKNADEDYPIQNKQHSFEFLREQNHLRTKTETISSIMRVRSILAFNIHNYFQKKGYVWFSGPIITSNDAEGAGETFVIQEFKQPFFNQKASLTVSSQLTAEAYAQSFQKVYTFGPVFRAEKSHTNRHLAEFWMIEPEIAFCDLKMLTSIIEDFLKTVISETIKQASFEFEFFQKNKPGLSKRINQLLTQKFASVEYIKVISILQEAVKSGHKFQNSKIDFGMNLASEHERYICEEIYNSPVFITNFPKKGTAFYMKSNSDDKTVASCDLLVPGVGEIVGGSQREDDYDKLKQRMIDAKISLKSMEWYLNLRKYGYYMSSGFGLGFERLLMYILDLDNIKEAIPFPIVEGDLRY